MRYTLKDLIKLAKLAKNWSFLIKKAEMKGKS